MGQDHAVVVLDEQWVFRFPRTPDDAARGAQERRLLARLNAFSDVATPRYEFVGSAGDFGGYRLIPGRELTEATFAALSRSKQEGVLQQIGAFLRFLHRQPAELVTVSGLAWSEEAAFVAARHIERRDKLELALGPNLLAAADTFYNALPSATATSRARVIHRDFTEDHILLDPSQDRLAGVIDFTDASLGDPAFDFAFLWAYGRWAAEHAAHHYGAGSDNREMIARSLWWYTRYRIDQVWWTVTGARDYDVAKVRKKLKGLFSTLRVFGA